MKRILAVILALLTFVSTISFTVFANPVGFQESVDYDTNEWVTNDQLMILSQLGITPWEDASAMGPRKDDILSRWYLAFYICRIKKLSYYEADGFEAPFKDLTSEHQYYTYIMTAVENGYLKAGADGKIRANEAASPMEIAEVLLRILDYGPYIDAMGLNAVLKNTDIFDGVKTEGEVSHGMFFRMVFNMLNSPAVKTDRIFIDGNGNADISYATDDDYLGFEHLYGVYHKTAVLDGVEGSNLNFGNDSIAKGAISLGGVNYEYETDVSELLGYRVNFVYKKGNDGKNYVMHLYKAEKNDELVLSYDEIDGFSEGVYYYYRNDKEKTAEISSTTRVIYNGIANPDYLDEEMIPKFGTVTFIDNDGKKGYEILKIENYEFWYISNYSAEPMKIYDTSGEASRILDLEDYDNVVVYNGEKEIAFDRLKKGNLLAVKKSGVNATYKKAECEMIKVAVKNFKISSIKDDYILSGETKYKSWKELTGKLEMGEIYNLYTFNDVVVMVTEGTEGGPEYAYLVSVGDDQQAFSPKARFAIVDTSGNYLEYDGAERIYVDGSPYTKVDVIKSRLFDAAQLSNGYNPDVPYAQPVRISFNSSGELNKLDTFVYDSEKEDESSLQIVEEAKGDTNRYNSVSRGLYNLEDGSTNVYKDLVASIESSTKILFIPKDRFDEDSYVSKSLLNGALYTVDVLGVDEKITVADVVLAYYDPDTQSVGYYTNYFIISDLYNELDDEGEMKYVVKGYLSYQERTYVCEESVFEQLSIGDIWKFEIGKNNTIVTAQKIFDIDEVPALGNREQVSSQTEALGGTRGYVYGTLIHHQGSFLKICQSLITDPEGFDPTYNEDNLYVGGTFGVYKYSVDRGMERLETSSLSSATFYSEDPENPSEAIITLAGGVSQICIIER